jgi:hypothetical protein
VLVTVTGQVTHYNTPQPAPQPKTKRVGAQEINSLPRVFCQTFVLALDPEQQQGPKVLGYKVVGDAMRFVG